MRREDGGLFFIVLVLTLAAVAYAGTYLARSAASDIKSYTVSFTVLRDTIPLRGVVIREECVLFADSPYVCLAVTEGERVGCEDLLAISSVREETLPAAETALALWESESLLRPLRAPDGRAPDSARLNAITGYLTAESAAALSRGELTRAASYLRPLGALLRREQSEAPVLTATADYSPLFAAQGGLVSLQTDSLESLTPEDLTDPDTLARLLADSPDAPVPGALGRLCTGSTWHFAALVGAESLDRFAPGEVVTLSLETLSVCARICSVFPGESEGVVLFSSREGLSAVLSRRFAAGEAVFSEQGGFLVSEEAVFSEDGECFVYRAAGRIAEKTVVSVLAHREGAALICAPSLREGATLLSGRGLSDGKLF